ncbi:MAG: methyltransferase, partial [Alphaproteobacteria bacterium]|nr:methyltransferase [Alphaproteobacteria bacterium]
MSIAALPYVEAELNYLKPMAERPRYYAYQVEPGEASSNMAADPHVMKIRSLRPIVSEIDLDRQGFALVDHKTAVKDFWDDDEVRRVYYPEAERFIKEYTGASRVFIFDHLQRRRVAGLKDRSTGGPRQPATRVHVDHTARSGPQRVR